MATDIPAEIAAKLGQDWLPVLYRDQIRTQRTRAVTIEIPTRENEVSIQYTLLGIELKVGKRRFACPDLAMARYMRVFARLGSTDFAVPYDITKVSVAADVLETSWQRALVILGEVCDGSTPRSVSAQRTRLVRAVREQVAEIGPGELMPAFDRPTRRGPSG